ncbi:MAG TPA: 50S ribosomal protein L22 [Candidatus Kapabacteria bacterium]|nr:50S ribosomal protein L22 [Candidatus Kapabacteria bacterium]HYM35865.1 50S ribosomal protein L22 [Steroidobacteraceae bacterium]
MAQAIAVKKNIQSSPVKMRLVLDHIRGKKVTEALSTLHFMTNKASFVAEQTLRSAIANFQMKDENHGINVEDLVISKCFSDGGPMLKRILPAPMGRAYRVRKRSNHLTIIVSDRAARLARAAAPPTEASAEAAAAPVKKKTSRKKKTVSA